MVEELLLRRGERILFVVVLVALPANKFGDDSIQFHLSLFGIHVFGELRDASIQWYHCLFEYLLVCEENIFSRQSRLILDLKNF